TTFRSDTEIGMNKERIKRECSNDPSRVQRPREYQSTEKLITILLAKTSLIPVEVCGDQERKPTCWETASEPLLERETARAPAQLQVPRRVLLPPPWRICGYRGPG